MDVNSLEIAIRNRKLNKKILIFSGPELFLKERNIEILIESYIPKEDRQENFSRVICNSKNYSEVIAQIYSFSFNPSPRVFLLTNSESLSSKARKDFFARLNAGGVPPDVIIIIQTEDSKTAKEVSSIFSKDAEKIDFWAPFENTIPQWIKKLAAENQCTISQEASNLLTELCGNSLRSLSQEIAKLSLSANNNQIDLKMVKTGVASSRQEDAFTLLDATGSRNAPRAMAIVETLSNHGEPIPKLWFMLTKQIREFRLLHDLVWDRSDLMEPIAEKFKSFSNLSGKTDYKSNMARKKIGEEITNISNSLPPLISDKLRLNTTNRIQSACYALNFTRSELVNMWPKIIETDKLMKSGIQDPRLRLQTFIAENIAKSKQT
jgi:DNA polymerase-3 subunit delta